MRGLRIVPGSILCLRVDPEKNADNSSLTVNPFGDLGALLGHPLNDELFVATVGGLSEVRLDQRIIEEPMLKSCELLEGEMAHPLEHEPRRPRLYSPVPSFCRFLGSPATPPATWLPAVRGRGPSSRKATRETLWPAGGPGGSFASGILGGNQARTGRSLSFRMGV